MYHTLHQCNYHHFSLAPNYKLADMNLTCPKYTPELWKAWRLSCFENLLLLTAFCKVIVTQCITAANE